MSATTTPRWHDRYALARKTAEKAARETVNAITGPGLLLNAVAIRELLDAETRDRIAAHVEAALLEWEDAIRA